MFVLTLHLHVHLQDIACSLLELARGVLSGVLILTAGVPLSAGDAAGKVVLQNFKACSHRTLSLGSSMKKLQHSWQT